jgi:hypothetical protein
MRTSPKEKKTKAIATDDLFYQGCSLCPEVYPPKGFGRGEMRRREGYPLPRVEGVEKCSACLLWEMTCPDPVIPVITEEA